MHACTVILYCIMYHNVLYSNNIIYYVEVWQICHGTVIVSIHSVQYCSISAIDIIAFR